jgi:hypothetical protein
MVFYTGLGYLVLPLFIAPLIVLGTLFDKGLGFDILRTSSWLPLHLLMILGALLVTLVGWLGNRKMVQEVIYEKSGPVTLLKPRHTLYWIRMEYWGPISLLIYFVLAALRYHNSH